MRIKMAAVVLVAGALAALPAEGQWVPTAFNTNTSEIKPAGFPLHMTNGFSLRDGVIGSTNVLFLDKGTNSWYLVPIAFVVPSTNVPSWVTNGLVHYWRMDEGSGTNGTDEIGAKTVTLLGTVPPAYATGKVGPYSLLYDGTSSYARAGSIVTNITKTGTYSVSLWFRPRSAPADTDLLFHNVVSGSDLLTVCFRTGPAQLVAAVYNGSAYYTKAAVTTPATNGWNLASVTFADTNITLYLNGIKATPGSGSPSATLGAGFTIGAANDNARNFDGWIDDVRVYNRALSSNEVFELWSMDN